MRIITIILCLYFLINCIIYILERQGKAEAYEEIVKRTSEKTGEENLHKLDFVYFLVIFFLGLPLIIWVALTPSQK